SGTTYYVSNSTGNDNNAGTSQSAPLKSVSKALSKAGANVRILFKRGDSWSISTGGNVTVAGPGIIGAYGSGNKPVIRTTGSAHAIKAAGSDWRIMDLSFVGPGPQTTSGVCFAGAIGNNNLFLRCDVQDFWRGLVTTGSPRQGV